MKYIIPLVLLIALKSFSQTPITNANFHHAIETCLTTNPVDGLCYSSEYGAMPDWDVSEVTDMSSAFYYENYFNSNISEWDVNNVTNMSLMFRNASDFNQDIRSWDVSNVTNMSHMFEGADDFNQGIGSWDVSNVTDMAFMFTSAGSFNMNIGSWNVSNVIYMRYMFGACYTFDQDISAWNVSNVTNMGRMFAASGFNQDISSWDVSNVIIMTGMFFNTSYFNQDISNWCVEQIPEQPFDFSTLGILLPEYHPQWGEECDTTVSYQEFRKILDLIIHPNPTRSWITIEIPKKEVKQINIYNHQNQKIYNTRTFTGKIDLSPFNSGLYIIEIITNDNQYRKRVIKQ